MNKAIFLDRDGVIVVPHFREGRSFAVRSMEEFRLYPDAKESLDLLKKEGFLLIVVSNQPDIGRGLVSPKTMEDMNRFLFQHLPIDAIRICPHTREEGCGCMKPNPGLLTAATKAFNIDCTASYMVGDRQSDIEAGRSVGCKAVFIDLGYTSEQRAEGFDFSSKTLLDAAFWIVNNNNTGNDEKPQNKNFCRWRKFRRHQAALSAALYQGVYNKPNPYAEGWDRKL